MSECSDCPFKFNCAKYTKIGDIEDNFCIRKFKLDALMTEALLSEKQMQHISLRPDGDNTDLDIFKNLKYTEDHILDFVRNGKSLYLYSSNTGNGKTSWALRLLRSYIHNIWIESEIRCRALYISVPKFFLALKDNISNKSYYIEHIKSNVNDCDLVIWDDIGTKVGTEFEIENLLNIINNRMDNGKANIYTSNMMPQQLLERVGERLYSRIITASGMVEFKGMDKRGI